MGANYSSMVVPLKPLTIVLLQSLGFFTSFSFTISVSSGGYDYNLPALLMKNHEVTRENNG